MEKCLEFYEKEDYFPYKKNKKEEGYKIISASLILEKFLKKENLEEYKYDGNLIIDISVLTEYINYQALAEQIIPLFSNNVSFICEKSKRDLMEFKLRFVFEEFRNIDTSILTQGKDKRENPSLIQNKLHRKIIDFTDEEIQQFYENFDDRLYGHPKFKADLKEQIESFRMFNRLKEHKVLSIFLLGDSGVGKTEVARAIFDCLEGKKKLAKINFGNYSNEFSLSSLIGAARGYIGSDDGEIFMKVRETDVGVLLIDEFEKSNASLFNYFLEVLESGKMTNSLGEEMDLNGFIIVFTSNIKKEDFKQRISPELRSRFDYKGRFLLLKTSDKKKYLEFRSDDIAKKVKAEFDKDIKKDLKKFLLKNINVSAFDNMRDINKQIKRKFILFYEQNEQSKF